MRSAAIDRAERPRGPGVALQPVIDLIDRVDLGYEALPRPADVSPRTLISTALTLAQHTGPAVLLVPLHRDLIAAAADDARLILARDPQLTGERGQAVLALQALFDWRPGAGAEAG